MLIISDGLDTGEPEDLSRELDWLTHRCRRLLWLNPLLRFEGYAPLARGAAVLHRHAHAMLAVHNLEKLRRPGGQPGRAAAEVRTTGKTRTMEMQGSRHLAVSQQQAWEALNDPQVLKTCIPGCDKVEPTGDSQYAIGMAVKVGPVAARFNGKIQLVDVLPPNSYTLAFEGQGGAAGFGKGTAKVNLAPPVEGAGCELNYTAQAQVGGKIAQVGQRLVDGVAKLHGRGLLPPLRRGDAAPPSRSLCRRRPRAGEEGAAARASASRCGCGSCSAPSCWSRCCCWHAEGFPCSDPTCRIAGPAGRCSARRRSAIAVPA